MQNVCQFECVDCSDKVKKVCYKYWKKRAYELANLYSKSTEERLKLEKRLTEKQADLDTVGQCLKDLLTAE